MKKLAKKPSIYLVFITLSSLILAIHFYSFKSKYDELNRSYEKLHQKHLEVLFKNEDLYESNQILTEQIDESQQSADYVKKNLQELQQK